jgi:uncharacterized protein (DUF58 family)
LTPSKSQGETVIFSRWLWTALVLLSIPTLLGGFFPGLLGVVLGVDVFLAALILIDIWFLRNIHIEASRILPSKIWVGIPNKIQIRVRHNNKQPVHIELVDDLPDLFLSTTDKLKADIPPQIGSTLSYMVRPLQRGRFAFSALHIRTRGPLRAAWKQIEIPLPEWVMVFPDLRGPQKLLTADALLNFSNLGIRNFRQDGSGTEFSRLRDYSPGDSLRDIDWKATARHRKPTTRVHESERSQMVLIAVDASRVMASLVNGTSKLDHAINAALFLAFVALKNKDRVGLIVFSNELISYVPPRSDRENYKHIADALYKVTLHLSYFDWNHFFLETSKRIRRRSLLCVFTDSGDEEHFENMHKVFPFLTKRHLPLCLNIRDSVSQNILHEAPKTQDEAWQYAVASETLSRRELFKKQMQQQGTVVADVAHDELPLVAVNRYLDAKRRGLL